MVFSARIDANESSGSSGVLSRWTRPPFNARGHLIEVELHGGRIGTAGPDTAEGVQQTSLGAGEDVGQFEVNPAARSHGEPFARRPKEAVPQAEDSALPGRSASRCLNSHSFRLNHEQRGPWPIDSQGDGAVGHSELGAWKKTGGGQAIGAENLEVRDDQVDSLEMNRALREDRASRSNQPAIACRPAPGEIARSAASRRVRPRVR